MIPSAVTELFEQYRSSDDAILSPEAAPKLVKRQNIDPNKIVKMVLMSDDLGRMQVVFPANCMLDVDQLNKWMGRSLTAVPSSDVSHLKSKLSLVELPAIPDITGLPTVVDSRILELDEVFVDSGDENNLIRLSKEFFRLSAQKAKDEMFSVPVSDIVPSHGSPESDIVQINEAIEKFTSLRIKKRLEDTLELPPLPQSAHDIIALRSNPDADVDDLATIVERDPSLSAQVVSWASSSFYNAPGKIRSVHDAIVRVLGFDMVMNLAMGLSLGRTLNVPKEQPEHYAPYWEQAILTALGTTSLISKIDAPYRPSFGMAYLSGLLHNFGYLILAHVFPPHFTLICRYIEANPHIDSSLIEHYLLGITKEQIGSQLMTVWNMPEEVTSALRHQKYSDYEGPAAEYANLLCLTEQLLSKHGLLNGLPEVDEKLLERFELSIEDADAAMQQLIESQEEINATANLMGR